MRTAQRDGALVLGAAALAAQLALQLAWHAWLAPGSRATLGLAVLPLLPGLWIALRNLRRGVLVGGIVSVFYFCHGIAGLWSSGSARILALAEIGLCLAVIGALYADARAGRATKSMAR